MPRGAVPTAPTAGERLTFLILRYSCKICPRVVWRKKKKRTMASPAGSSNWVCAHLITCNLRITTTGLETTASRPRGELTKVQSKSSRLGWGWGEEAGPGGEVQGCSLMDMTVQWEGAKSRQMASFPRMSAGLSAVQG